MICAERHIAIIFMLLSAAEWSYLHEEKIFALSHPSGYGNCH